MKPRAVLLMQGLPGSGKSTTSRLLVEKGLPSGVREQWAAWCGDPTVSLRALSRDEIRGALRLPALGSMIQERAVSRVMKLFVELVIAEADNHIDWMGRIGQTLYDLGETPDSDMSWERDAVHALLVRHLDGLQDVGIPIIDAMHLDPRHVDVWRDMGMAILIADHRGVPLDTCIARARARASEGGHDIAEAIIRQRHEEWIQGAVDIPQVDVQYRWEAAPPVWMRGRYSEVTIG